METKKISQLPVAESLSESTNVLVEENGSTKRIPASKAIPSGVVKSVNGSAPDENGNVTVEIPEGFSGSWNDLEDRPFYKKVTYSLLNNFVDITHGYAASDLDVVNGCHFYAIRKYGTPVEVIYDGEKYNFIDGFSRLPWDYNVPDDYGMTYHHAGNPALCSAIATGYGLEDNGLPFCIVVESPGRVVFYFNDSDSHDISIYGSEIDLKTIDPDVLPSSVVTDDEIHVISKTGSWNDLDDKPFGENTVLVMIYDYDKQMAGALYNATGEHANNSGILKISSIIPGDTYTVRVDGVDYTEVARWDEDTTSEGNNGIEMGADGSSMWLSTYSNGVYISFGEGSSTNTHSLAIYHHEKVVNPLDPKFLPNEGKVTLNDLEGLTERTDLTHDSASIGIYNLGYATLPYEFFPAVDEEYSITWDSTNYTCTATTLTVDEEEVVVVGNTTFFGGSDNTDIPFGILCRSGKAMVYSNESGEHTIYISGYEHVPQKVLNNYVDSNPLVGVIDSSYYNYRYLNPAKGASITEVRKAAVEGNRDIVIRLELDNWQGTLRYMGLTNVSTDGETYAQALLFSTIKANDVSINASDEVVDGTMQLEYWYAMLEPTQGPPSEAFVNLQFAEVNLVPGKSCAGYYMRVNEDGFWEATEGPEDFSGSWNDLEDKPFYEITPIDITLDGTLTGEPIFEDVIESEGGIVEKYYLISAGNYSLEAFKQLTVYLKYNGEYTKVTQGFYAEFSGGIHTFRFGCGDYDRWLYWFDGKMSCAGIVPEAGIYYVHVEGRDVPSFRVFYEGCVIPLPTTYLPTTVPVVQTAQVGQTVVVKAVDADGKPTEWEAVDMSAGGQLIIPFSPDDATIRLRLIEAAKTFASLITYYPNRFTNESMRVDQQYDIIFIRGYEILNDSCSNTYSLTFDGISSFVITNEEAYEIYHAWRELLGVNDA